MIRYIMSFAVPPGRQLSAQKVIDHYFEDLYKHGPGGMRSQCYSDNNDDCSFVHIKSFKKESVANHHFKSSGFRSYIQQLEATMPKPGPHFQGFSRNSHLNLSTKAKSSCQPVIINSLLNKLSGRSGFSQVNKID